jgi:hypothetical protein
MEILQMEKKCYEKKAREFKKSIQMDKIWERYNAYQNSLELIKLFLIVEVKINASICWGAKWMWKWYLR